MQDDQARRGRDPGELGSGEGSGRRRGDTERKEQGEEGPRGKHGHIPPHLLFLPLVFSYSKCIDKAII